jgi:broad specificity phosphatase PhoE
LEPGICEWLKESWFTALPTFDYNRLQREYSIDLEYEPFYKELKYPESIDEMIKRYQTTIQHLISQYIEKQILIVTHGYGIQCMIEYISPNLGPIYDIPFACLTKFVKVGSYWISAKIASDAHLM